MDQDIPRRREERHDGGRYEEHDERSEPYRVGCPRGRGPLFAEFHVPEHRHGVLLAHHQRAAGLQHSAVQLVVPRRDLRDLVVHARDRSVADGRLLGRVEGDDGLHERIEQFLVDVVRHLARTRDARADLVELVHQHEDDLGRGRHQQHVGRAAVVHGRVRAPDVADLRVPGAEGRYEERAHEGAHAEEVDGANQLALEERVLVVLDGDLLAGLLALLQRRRGLGEVLDDGVRGRDVQVRELRYLCVGEVARCEREALVRGRPRLAERRAQLRHRERHAPDVDRVDDGHLRAVDLRGEAHRQEVEVAQRDAASGGQGEERARSDCAREGLGAALEHGRRAQAERQLREVEDVRIAELAQRGVQHAASERGGRQGRGRERTTTGLHQSF